MLKYEPIVHPVTFQEFNADVLRLDLIHPLYGGNKYFKLKHNYLKAKELGYNQLLTFGGAHSNHIFSTAAFCREYNFKCIAVIRGEAEMLKQSPTLQFAVDNGAALYFISREKYSRKTGEELLKDLHMMFGEFYLVPEGGNNMEGVKGCTEILPPLEKNYDYIFCACGTACTFSGLYISAAAGQKVIGISVLKGENTLIETANKWIAATGKIPVKTNTGNELNASTILSEYHFGGYARFNRQIISFKHEFERTCNIPLDYVYTAKLFFAVFDLLEKKRVDPGKKILIVHSGGLQGNAAFESRYSIG